MARASSKPLAAFPLVLIPLAIYNIIAFLMPGVGFAVPLATLALPSSSAWPVTMGDVLISLGVMLLFLEMMKSSQPGARFLTDHILAFLVFGGALAEFLLLKPFANSTFFLLTLLAGIEFVAGTALALRFRRAGAAQSAPAPVFMDSNAHLDEPPVYAPEKIEPRLDDKPIVDVTPTPAPPSSESAKLAEAPTAKAVRDI